MCFWYNNVFLHVHAYLPPPPPPPSPPPLLPPGGDVSSTLLPCTRVSSLLQTDRRAFISWSWHLSSQQLRTCWVFARLKLVDDDDNDDVSLAQSRLWWSPFQYFTTMSPCSIHAYLTTTTSSLCWTVVFHIYSFFVLYFTILNNLPPNHEQPPSTSLFTHSSTYLPTDLSCVLFIYFS